jgi:hypothetical protein
MAKFPEAEARLLNVKICMHCNAPPCLDGQCVLYKPEGEDYRGKRLPEGKWRMLKSPCQQWQKVSLKYSPLLSHFC